MAEETTQEGASESTDTGVAQKDSDKKSGTLSSRRERRALLAADSQE